MHIHSKSLLTIALASAGLVLPSSTLMAGKIYWVQSFDDRIGRANFDGTGPQVLPTFVFDPLAIAVDPAGGKFYFIQSLDDKVLRADLDGTNVTPVLVPPRVFDPVAIAVDSVGGKIYCAQSFDDKIIRANLDGSASESILAPPISVDPVAVAVDSIAGKVYWAENPGNRIRRANLDGTNAETVVDSIFVADAVSIAVDGANGKLYWAERSEDRIRRADTGGFNLNVVTFLDAVFVSDPVSLSLDSVNARIFWAEATDSRIRRADLTGTGAVTILEAPLLFDPLSISVDPTPSQGVVVVWNSDPLSHDRTTRSLRFRVQAASTATATPGQSAIKVTMIDLQNPVPPNLLQNPPPNFSGYEAATCAPMKCVGGANNGLTCAVPADCPSPGVCTTAGESNGCARWVGKPGVFLESQDNPAIGSYRSARLQCTPHYTDWAVETAGALIAVVGAEIAPSSEYRVQTYAASCKGMEGSCTGVSAPVTMYTRRSGDVEASYCPPSCGTGSGGQPNVTDVAQLVNKIKNVAGAPVKAISQIQPNLPEPNADINALDILAVVNGVKQLAYSFGGPCACPSSVTCGPAVGSVACSSPTVCVTAFGTGATCVRTCAGGANDGDPCINDSHCPGGACGGGFCRDRCGRCTP